MEKKALILYEDFVCDFVYQCELSERGQDEQCSITIVPISGLLKLMM
ncbi:hypothetical protein XBKB1_1490011 [Xenorhabdus bovienii str. kraussei Becker Underwood]|uniref:Uncharacterized protein n=1 Tax=Xenorhabdus bovienii str. kraussei Becker Underwood TaxID=1398204 RepID=A0A077PT66_XENBV|nr:hypothetical protein XBKB1_1490011 [Xenorhabdus bovienii str. kraussei Becker Underwood]